MILFTNGTALAKGPPDKITISAPGLPAEIEITGSQTLDAFSMGQFVDFEMPIEEPHNPFNGYKITRWYRVGSTRLKAIDSFVYYPSHQANRGYIFYEGIIDKMFIYGGSPYDGKWFQVTEGGELTMRQVLAEFDISTNTQSSQLTWPAELLKWVGYGGPVVGGVILYVSLVFLAGRLRSRRKII